MKRIICTIIATTMLSSVAYASDSTVSHGWKFFPVSGVWTEVGEREVKDYTEMNAMAKARITELSNLEDKDGIKLDQPVDAERCEIEDGKVVKFRKRSSVAYENADFKDGVKTLAISVNSPKTGATVSARIDSPSGQEIGRLVMCAPINGDYEVQPMAIDESVTGVHKLYIVGEEITEDISIEYVKLIDMEPKGATMPFVTVEAEDARVSATAAVNTIRTHPSTADNNNNMNTPEQKAVQSASGKKYVQLSAQTEYVEFTAPIDANRLLLRYTIPRNTTGTLSMYINGELQEAVELDSKYCYDQTTLFYQRSYDEKIILKDVKKGDRIKFQKNPENRCAYYGIDLLEFEMAPQANEMPEGYLSITDFGAVANDDIDDTKAIQACADAAKEQNMHVWFPEGQFIQTVQIQVPENVNITGSGIWYTELFCPVTEPTKNPWGGYVGFRVAENSVISDMMVSGNSTFRDDQGIAIMGTHDMSGNNIIIDNIWFRNMSTVTGWAGLSNSVIKNCRMHGIYADAIHFGDVPQINNLAINNHIRGCGDDGVAVVIRQDYTDRFGREANNLVARYNTISSGYWGRGVSIVGGNDVIYTDNIIDSCYLAGVIITTETLGPSPSTRINNAWVQRNSITNCGHNNHNHASMHFWMYAQPVSNINIEANEIAYGSTRGISIDGAVYGDEEGRTEFNYNNVHDNADINYRNGDPMKMKPILDGNTGM